MENVCQTWAPRLLSVFRVVLGVLFLEHGMAKLFAFPAGAAPAGFTLVSILGLSALLEFFGGILLIAGLFTRATAFILSGEMAVAYFMAHSPKGFFPILNHGEAAIFYCFAFLYLAAAGGGPWSIDGKRDRST
jgi:putative oxidoreductase